MALINVEDVLSKLSTKDKIDLLSGIDYWHTHALPKHGVVSLRFSDGPNGARGTKNFNSVPAAAFPCGTALGATFNQSLLYSAGILMGEETMAKGAHVLLGPCVNMQRSPLGGRGFESISEDPVLSGLAAAAIVRGIESTGVAACIKHFVCNDQEHQRTLFNAIVTPRAMREIYLKPFQIAQRDSNPSVYMTAYNKVNGVHASESPKILENILRNEWGWSGLVISDWFGTYSTTEAVLAGLDLEMPGPSRWRASILNHAVNSGKVPPRVLDDRARAVLRLVRQSAKSGILENAPEGKRDTPETAALLRQLAVESIVLLKHESRALPLSKNKTTLMIGPNVREAVFCGGGSSALTPYYAVSPWDGVQAKMAKSEMLTWALGAYTHKELPLIGSQLVDADGKPGFNFRVYNDPPTLAGREMAEDIRLTDSHMLLQDFSSSRVTSSLWYATMTGTFTATVSGVYDFGLCVYGTANLYIDDQLLIENTTNQKQGTQFYGTGTIEERGSLGMCAGQRYEVRIEFASAPTNTLGGGGVVRFGGGGLRVGCARRIEHEEEIKLAVQAAQKADQVVIVAALGPDWEGEGHDRSTMKLPGHMDNLISAVAKAHRQTVVVLQTGTPVEMPWADNVAAIVQGWYLGNEAGNALADVLFGDVSPSGKLSMTFPRSVKDNPAYLNYRSEGGRTLYGEDVYIGYRYYDAVEREVLFPFGHGLTYSTFHLGTPTIRPVGEMLEVNVELHNTGDIPAGEVVQVYVSPTNPDIRRPVKELQGFTKLFLQPGERKIASISMLKKYATAHFDEDRDMWKSQKDMYHVLVGTSSAGPFVTTQFELPETFWWRGL